MLEFELKQDFPDIESFLFEEDWEIFANNRQIARKDYYNFYYSYGSSWKPRSILEIGVRRGYSAVSMAIGTGDSLQRFVGIDSEIDVPASSVFAEQLLKKYTNAEIKFLNVDTQKDSISGDMGSFDLIHVDADHTFHGCINDILLALSLSQAGTKIVVDDCLYAPVRAAFEAVVELYSSHLLWRTLTNFRGHGLIEVSRSFPELSSKQVRYEISSKKVSPFATAQFHSLSNKYSLSQKTLERSYQELQNPINSEFLSLINETLILADIYLLEVIKKINITLNFVQKSVINPEQQIEEIVNFFNSIKSQIPSKKLRPNYFAEDLIAFLSNKSKLYYEEVNLCRESYARLALLNQLRSKLVRHSKNQLFSYFYGESAKHFDYLNARLSETSNNLQLPQKLCILKNYRLNNNNYLISHQGHLLLILLMDALINVLSCFEGELEFQYWVRQEDKLPKMQQAQSKPRKLEIGTIFDPSTHYTEEYYAGAGLEYMKPNGTWDIYHGPAPTWHGFGIVVDIMDRILAKEHGRKLLDVGCSFGDFVHKAVHKGWDAYGVDLSSKAIEKAHPEVQNRLISADITQPNEALKEKAPFDIITTLDFWEHIYETDLDELMAGLFKLLRPGGVMFNIICTYSHIKEKEDWVIKKGETFTQENSGLLCCGHVTIHKWNWWVQKFREHGYVPRHDLAYSFQVGRAEDRELSTVMSWSPRNLIILSKPD